MKTIIIIPAFNEAQSIHFVVGQLKDLYPDFKVLVINDGSTDHTRNEALTAGAEVISLPVNLGIGGAMQTGFKTAFREGYDIAVQFDGDAQHDPKFIRNLIAPIESKKLDLCIGSRFLSGDSPFKSTFARRLGIGFFIVLLRALTGLPLTDPTSGFRAHGKKLIKIFAKSYPVDFPEPETIKIAKRLDAKIGEVPVHMLKRLGGKSSIRFFKTFYYMAKVTLAILVDCLKTQPKRSTS